jgi:uncharacterized protein with ParB-like and HNH nuclease domain
MKNKEKLKWQDIPKFPTSHYTIDVPWSHLESNLETLRGDGELRLDPDYQRAHVWTRKQQVEYIEFQLMGGELSRTIIFNAPYWKDCKIDPKDTYIELLDGKQRLEAVRSFLRGDFKVFNQKFDEFEGNFPTMEYRFRYQVCCLNSREDVLNLYLKINAGGTPHNKKELDRVKKLLEKERTEKKEKES